MAFRLSVFGAINLNDSEDENVGKNTDEDAIIESLAILYPPQNNNVTETGLSNATSIATTTTTTTPPPPPTTTKLTSAVNASKDMTTTTLTTSKIPATETLTVVSPTKSGVGDTCVSFKLWGTPKVLLWLQSCGLQYYCDVFTHHRVTGLDLFTLCHQDLIAMGIDALGQRKTILKETDELRNPTDLAGGATHSRVVHSNAHVGDNDSMYLRSSRKDSLPHDTPISRSDTHTSDPHISDAHISDPLQDQGNYKVLDPIHKVAATTTTNDSNNTTTDNNTTTTTAAETSDVVNSARLTPQRLQEADDDTAVMIGMVAQAGHVSRIRRRGAIKRKKKNVAPRRAVVPTLQTLCTNTVETMTETEMTTKAMTKTKTTREHDRDEKSPDAHCVSVSDDYGDDDGDADTRKLRPIQPPVTTISSSTTLSSSSSASMPNAHGQSSGDKEKKQQQQLFHHHQQQQQQHHHLEEQQHSTLQPTSHYPNHHKQEIDGADNDANQITQSQSQPQPHSQSIMTQAQSIKTQPQPHSTSQVHHPSKTKPQTPPQQTQQQQTQVQHQLQQQKTQQQQTQQQPQLQQQQKQQQTQQQQVQHQQQQQQQTQHQQQQQQQTSHQADTDTNVNSSLRWQLGLIGVATITAAFIVLRTVR